MTARSAVALAALAWAGATGCVSLKSSGEARFYVLAATAPPASFARGTAASVGVLPVRLAGYLDRPQIVTGASDHEVEIHEFARWAEPLDRAALRVIGENLAHLLPDRQVLVHPWLPFTATHRVAVEISSFSRQASGAVVLSARWAVLPQKGDLALERGRLEAERPAPAPQDYSGLAESMNDLLLELSRAIARDVTALPVEERSSEEEATKEGS